MPTSKSLLFFSNQYNQQENEVYSPLNLNNIHPILFGSVIPPVYWCLKVHWSYNHRFKATSSLSYLCILLYLTELLFFFPFRRHHLNVYQAQGIADKQADQLIWKGRKLLFHFPWKITIDEHLFEDRILQETSIINNPM